MVLNKKIPADFYKLFRTKNMDFYMMFLVAIYEENNEVYTTLGLTVEECKAIISEMIARTKIVWEEEEEEQETEISGASPSAILNHLIQWGWMKRDFDEKLNTYVISFPEYSQLYVELFRKLQSDDDSRERESILSIYSTLFTFHIDREKNNDILKTALHTSKSLSQLLSNMQDGMRSYFDELSSKKNFIGIQQVLVEEINNNDSKKYAILTTTDSFYRYKEAVKELLDKILVANDEKKIGFLKRQQEFEKDSIPYIRNEHSVAYCEETSRLVAQIDREFSFIERKYNKLIEQKAVFAQRALARIHYILQEGTSEEDNTVKLINLIDKSNSGDAILQELSEKMHFTTQYRTVTESSLYSRRGQNNEGFHPKPMEQEKEAERSMTDFVPKPLYTKKELNIFKEKNRKDGKFVATRETVESVEDLEKLLFIWQEATENRLEKDKVSLGDEIEGENGVKFSSLEIDLE